MRCVTLCVPPCFIRVQFHCAVSSMVLRQLLAVCASSGGPRVILQEGGLGSHNMKPSEPVNNDRAATRLVADQFRKLYGEPVGVFRAPGRVNLIGEHTDYNDGFVM